MKKIFSFFASRMFIFFALIALQAIFFVLIFTALSEYRPWLQAAFSAAGVFLVLFITSKGQDPGYKIAWIILILLLPVFGMLMYFFFSQRKLNKKQRQRAADVFLKSRPYLDAGGAPGALSAQNQQAARQSRYLENAALYPPYQGTGSTYYPTGEPFFKDLLADLERAEHFIFLEYFIIAEGVMWNSILEILERKVRAGVDVRVIYDGIGCINTLPARYQKTLEQKGIRCYVFNKLVPVLNSMFNNRDHRKIAVIDGKTGYCGGANLADEYINKKQRFGNWKDASIRLEGAGVWPLLLMFLHIWEFVSGDDVDISRYAGCRRSVENDGFVQPFADSPTDDAFIGENMYLGLISQAREYIYVNTPYMVPTGELMTALTNAAQSGLDVRVTVPHIPDKKSVYWVTQAYCAQLVKAGVKVYEYLPGFIHSKTLVCDDRYGVVGTVNMDYRSLFLNFECGVWMYGAACVADMKRDYLETCAQSREVTLAQTRATPWYKRFVQTVLRIFGPLM